MSKRRAAYRRQELPPEAKDLLQNPEDFLYSNCSNTEAAYELIDEPISDEEIDMEDNISESTRETLQNEAVTDDDWVFDIDSSENETESTDED